MKYAAGKTNPAIRRTHALGAADEHGRRATLCRGLVMYVPVKGGFDVTDPDACPACVAIIGRDAAAATQASS